MKIKYFKRALTVVLALAMLFTLSMVSFATGDGEVIVIVRNASYNLTTHQNSYTQLDSFLTEINTSDTVYDVINAEYGNAATWTGSFLTGITLNSVNYSSVYVEAAASCYNNDAEYIGGNAIIDSLNLLDEFDECDGVYMSMAMLLEDESFGGYYIMGDMQHMCSISYDWIYEVDYASDGYGNFVYPPNSTTLYGPNTMYTMDQCELHDGDIVRLTYGLVWMIFE